MMLLAYRVGRKPFSQSHFQTNHCGSNKVLLFSYVYPYFSNRHFLCPFYSERRLVNLVHVDRLLQQVSFKWLQATPAHLR